MTHTRMSDRHIIATSLAHAHCDMFTICLCISPDLDGMFHGMFVYQSGLKREQGTKNEILALQDPQQVSKPKYDMFHDMFVHKSGLRRVQGVH
jgi:hypothetical protein